MLERAFHSESVVAVPLRGLASPGERRRRLPAGGDRVRPQCACRPAGLADARLELLGVDEPSPAALQRNRSCRIPRDAHGRRIERPGLDVPAMLVGLACVESARFDLHLVDDQPRGEHAEADVRRIEPVVGDRRFGRIDDRFAVHEGGRPERRLARQAAVHEDAAVPADCLRRRRRKLHEQVVRMLAIDQPIGAVRSLAAGKKQRVAARAHQRVGADHRLELQRSVAQRVLRHAHQHSARERLVVAARARLVVVDEVERAVCHQHPVAAHYVQPALV